MQIPQRFADEEDSHIVDEVEELHMGEVGDGFEKQEDSDVVDDVCDGHLTGKGVTVHEVCLI